MALASLSDIKRLSYSSSQSSMQLSFFPHIPLYMGLLSRFSTYMYIEMLSITYPSTWGNGQDFFYIYWNVIIFKLKFSWYITNIYLLVKKNHNTSVKFLINRVRKDVNFFYRLILYMREQIWTLLHWLPI